MRYCRERAFALVLATTLCPASASAAIPANDNFATRTAISGTNVTVAGNNAGAGFEPGEPDPSQAGGKSVWWTWTAPFDGSLTASTAGSQFDTLLTVFTGDALTNLTLAAFNDTETNTSTIHMNVLAGTAYQIAVDGYLNATGSISLHLQLGPWVTAPVHDHFTNRTTLTGTHLSNIPANNSGATAEPDEPFHADQLGGKSVWWTWTAPASGGLTLTTKGSWIDTLLAIHTGDSLANLVLVAANDENPASQAGLESLVKCNVVAGMTYQIVVDGYDGDAGDIRLGLDLGSAIVEPANDDFANRILLTGTSIRTNVSNQGASYEPGEPLHLATFGGRSVWWSWTAPSSGGVTITASNDVVDTVLCVYRGTQLASLSFVAGNDENYLTLLECDSKVSFNATSGVTYQIAVDGYDTSAGTFTLALTLGSSTTVPSNDLFANRKIITGTDTTVTGSNVGATRESGEPLHDSSYGGKSVWWRWTSPGTGYVTVDTIGSVCDTLLAIYTGTTLSTLVEVASDDESGGNYSSLVTFNTRSNVTYQIAVDGYDDDAGDIRLRVRFVSASYSLVTSANPAGSGSVLISPLPDQLGKYAPGTVVSLTAQPSAGGGFQGWTGSATSLENPLALTMNANKTLTAAFSVPQATLRAYQPQGFQSLRTTGFRYLLSGPTNFSYIVERTTNLITWSPFQTNLLVSTNQIFKDASASNSPARFYRVHTSP